MSPTATYQWLRRCLLSEGALQSVMIWQARLHFWCLQHMHFAAVLLLFFQTPLCGTFWRI